MLGEEKKPNMINLFLSHYRISTFLKVCVNNTLHISFCENFENWLHYYLMVQCSDRLKLNILICEMARRGTKCLVFGVR